MHTWTFFRAGGLDQVLLATADDLRHLGELDPKLWVALSCPVKGLEFDARTLELIDTDRDGRVRVPELLEAVSWACARLNDPAALLSPAGGLPLAAIDDTRPEGRALLASVKGLLASLGKPDAAIVTVEDTSDTVRIFGQTTLNGDGIVIPESASDPALRRVIEEVVATGGADVDRSGKPGAGRERIGRFFDEVAAYDAWRKAGRSPEVRVLGDATEQAWEALVAVRAKVDDFFARGRLAAFDPRALAHVNRAESAYETLAAKDLSRAEDDVAALPIQQVSPARTLRFSEPVNPAWAARLERLRREVVRPLAGEADTLDEVGWRSLCERFNAYAAWVSAKQGASVESLGAGRIEELASSPLRAALERLVDEDVAMAPALEGLENADRLARYHRDLHQLLRNFVNFADFYDRAAPPPVFVAGRLFLDQRTCGLCIRVDDAAAHAALASHAKVFLAYVACTRPSGEKMTVAAAFTQGDSDQLMVGRNGVLFDRKGRDWDATIVKIVDHPISIAQAFWSPYDRIGKMVSDTIERVAGSADKAVAQRANERIGETAGAMQGAGEIKKPAIDTGMLAAIGIAATSLVSALSGIAAALFGLPAWKIPLVVLGALLAVSGPSMVIAFLKLRQRTLGPLLEANGWAINGRVKINIPLGTSLTHAMELPPRSRRLLDDPFEDVAARRRNRLALVGGVLVLLAGAYWAWHHRPVAAEPAPQAEVPR